jgi:hypothetical protein
MRMATTPSCWRISTADRWRLPTTPPRSNSALGRRYGDRALAFPHHIGYRTGARGINWATFDPELSPFVEMFSMHGCAETSETNALPAFDGAGRRSLDHGRMGWPRGMSSASSATPITIRASRAPTAMAACRCYAPGHDRDAFWAAMRRAHTTALTGDRIHLLAEIDGAVQGDVIAPRAGATLGIEAVAGGAIDCIDVIRNGRLWHRISPALDPAPVDPEGADETLIISSSAGARAGGIARLGTGTSGSRAGNPRGGRTAVSRPRDRLAAGRRGQRSPDPEPYATATGCASRSPPRPTRTTPRRRPRG